MFLIIAAVWMSSCLLTSGNAVGGRKKRQAVSTCTDGYESVPGGKTSTMCLTDSANYVVGSAVGVSEADKTRILELHNQYRTEIAAPKMLTLYWDDELARVAEKWTKQCSQGHEGSGDFTHLSRYITLFNRVSGQNAAYDNSASVNWESAVELWYAEKQYFQYGVAVNQTTGHYTQMILDRATLIGCGYAECTGGDYTRFYICNYMTPQSDYTHPYVQGSACSECASHCPNGNLCDCGETMTYCYNGGTLDWNTCTCQCTEYYQGDTCEEQLCAITGCLHYGVFDSTTCTCDCSEYQFWSGDRCETKTCFSPDKWWCSDYTVADCTGGYVDTPWWCPNLCGEC